MYLAEKKMESLVDPESSSATASANGVNDNDANTTGNVFSAQEEATLLGMTTDYIFPGWVAFKIFGPMAPEAFQLTLLETEDLSKEKKKAGNHTNT
jgi:hypothetical protein